jgi:hypothetical protein
LIVVSSDAAIAMLEFNTRVLEMEEEGAKTRQRCNRCKKIAPDTKTNYTLISVQYGWRMTRIRCEDGTFDVLWHCPQCWPHFKASKAPAGSSGQSTEIPKKTPFK